MLSSIGRPSPRLNPFFGVAFLVFTASCSAFRPLPTRQAEPMPSKAQSIESTGSEIQDAGLKGGTAAGFDIEDAGDAQFRYAILIDVEVESLKNRRLYDYIGEWWGTPYRLGGDGRSGIDCSAFVKGLQSAVYGLSVPRVTTDQQKACRPVAEPDRREGDILFFRTGDGVMHVGVYLQNHRFVHASTSRGVVIDDMRSDYWRKAYLGTGRPPE
jgi:lipoprotein Spr